MGFTRVLDAQPSTGPCGLKISILTSGPGDPLYATWGHSAVRVIDSVRFTDMVFNYGTFDFDTPGFYTKFVRGTLMYFLSYETFDEFREEDREDNRQLSEQVLDLNCADKEKIYQFLVNNYDPTHRYYPYDYLYDNCSTRIRDLLVTVFGSRLKFNGSAAPSPGFSYRQACDLYLKTKTWTRLGIDLVYGLTTDTPAGARGIMFLPDFLEKALVTATLDGNPLDTTERVLLAQVPESGNQDFPFTPLPVFTLVLILIAALSFSRVNPKGKLLHWVDIVLFFVTGLVGCFILILWLGTVHTQFSRNLNLLWALPTHCLFSIFLDRRRGWVKIYAAGTAILGMILLVTWYWLPQQLPGALLPLIAALVIRSWSIFRLNYQAGFLS